MIFPKIYSEKEAQDLNFIMRMTPWGALDWLPVTSVKIVVKCLNQPEESNCTIFTYYNATQIRKKQLSVLPLQYFLQACTNTATYLQSVIFYIFESTQDIFVKIWDLPCLILFRVFPLSKNGCGILKSWSAQLIHSGQDILLELAWNVTWKVIAYHRRDRKVPTPREVETRDRRMSQRSGTSSSHHRRNPSLLGSNKKTSH